MAATKKSLLLGSGELGCEFVISAKRLGAHVVACDAYAGAPAMQVADECEVFSMLDGAALGAAIDKHKPDFIVPEVEAIRTEVLKDYEDRGQNVVPRSEEHTSELQSLMRISYAVFCLKKKKQNKQKTA